MKSGPAVAPLLLERPHQVFVRQMPEHEREALEVAEIFDFFPAKERPL